MIKTAANIVRLVWNHPANRGRRLPTLTRSILWQLRKRSRRAPMNFRLPNGLTMRCYPDSSNASNTIYFNGMQDLTELLFLQHYLRPGDNVIDAGANVGVYTLYLAPLIAPGEILAFEPDAICVERLRENIARNDLKNVTVREAAVADYRGTAEFSLGEDAAGSFANLREAEATRTVEVVRLDEEITKPFAAGKIDVEGAEPAAFRGAALEKHNPPVWLIELTRRTLKRSGTTLEEFVAMLDGAGFDLWTYDPQGRELIEWTQRPRAPGHVGDAIAIARPHLDRVRERVASFS